MTAGLAWSYNQETSSPVSPNDLETWKVVPMRDTPGEKFEYNTMLPHMMSAVLTKAGGKSTKEFADSFLFKPLGISEVQWSKDNDGIYFGGSETLFKIAGYGKVRPSLPQQRNVERPTSWYLENGLKNQPLRN